MRFDADKLTASQAGAWLAEEKKCRLQNKDIESLLDMASINYPKKATKAELLELLETVDEIPLDHSSATIQSRHNAICKILGEISGCDVPDQWEVDPGGPAPRNPAMWAIWNGIRMEDEAVKAFEKWSGETIDHVGFCLHKSKVAGCSPDGLLADKSIGFEGKAPLPATHINYVLNNQALIEQYGDQCHFSMAVTGATAWWLQSYCPGLPAARVLIQRDEYTERMVQGIEEFAEQLDSARQEIAALWDEHFNDRGDARPADA
jgi:hypothetical protein